MIARLFKCETCTSIIGTCTTLYIQNVKSFNSTLYLMLYGLVKLITRG